MISTGSKRTIVAATIVLLGACAGPEGGGEATTITGTPVSSEPVSTSLLPVSTVVRLESTTEAADEVPSGSVRVELAALPTWRFVPDQLTVAAGDVVFFLVNTLAGDPDPNFGRHTLAIGPSRTELIVVSSAVRAGDSASFTVMGLEEGEYIFWCTIEDHASQGMVGTLTVG